MNWLPELTNGEMTVFIFATWVVLMTWIYHTKDPSKKDD